MNTNNTNNTIVPISYKLNKHGGVYTNGKAFTKEKWVEICVQYFQLQAELGDYPTVEQLAKYSMTSIDSARKAIRFAKQGFIELPEQGTKKKGVGSIMQLSEHEVQYILQLYNEEPTRPNYSYKFHLYMMFGRGISESSISNLFLKYFPYKSSFCKTSTFPPQKYSTKNTQRVQEYIEFIQNVNMNRVAFADEKHVKGCDIFKQKVRINPLNGLKPDVVANGDLRNVYNLIATVRHGSTNESCVFYKISEQNGDSESFYEYVVEGMIGSGFLNPGDILIVDNARIHFNGYCDGLDDYLWEYWHILLVPLPTYSPEYNPTELLFHTLVERMRAISIRSLCESNTKLLQVVNHILMNVTPKDVYNFFAHCGYVCRL